jgi:hypothetical protein
MPTRRRLLPLVALLLSTAGCRLHGAAPPGDAAPREAALVLDELHRLAAAADGEAYFALFEPDARYLGTDAGESWTLAEFRAYAEPWFAEGRGWSYSVRERHLSLAEDGRTAWFDERLDNAKYGECRGSGVLVRGERGWRIAQYVLSLPVPNELALDLVARIRALEAPVDSAAGDGGL